MTLLSSIFSAGVRVRNALYDRSALPIHRLDGPVVSVGNLSVGGTGKTPFVILLGTLLKQRGIAFDILSRGYGRSSKNNAAKFVDPGGSPRDFGDEPLLIARKLGVPVIVAQERYLGGRLAEEKFGPQLHLLDDGFQHRQLARDFDIVLLTPDDVRDRLLPSGRLREPLSSLRRADTLVLTSGAGPEQFPLFGKPLWRLHRGISVDNVPAARPVAFCGIARPQNFFLQLRTAGIEPAAEAVFRDHHAYTAQDVRDLLRLAEQSEADGFVTTEKDFINLDGMLSGPLPVAAIPIKMDLLEADRALDFMLATIADRRRRRT